MTHPSPLRPFYEQADAAFIPYGEGAEIVGTIGPVEREYAAIRKGVGMFDCPHRGLLKLTGEDRLDFLHRMATHDCRSLAPGDVRRMFLLNAKGRIMGDLLVIHQDNCTLIDLDIHDAAPIAAEMDKLLFSEDVKIENLSTSHHRVSFHGPRAAEFLDWAESQKSSGGWRFRFDETGSPGWHIWAPAASFGGIAGNDESLARRFGLRDIGWLAYNIARIEAGSPLFHVDFGPDSLPHETGLLKQTVSFTKGCYRGQEIVARMENLGHPAKVLVGFRVQPPNPPEVPVAGSPVYDSAGAEAKVVGGITSSTFSPMNSQQPVGFAIVKWDFRTAGKTLYTLAESRSVPIAIHELGFLSAPSTKETP